MTNRERQKSLDKKKYECGQNLGIDPSGVMPYCVHCTHKTSNYGCSVSHEVRSENCFCAQAYNRMVRRKSRHVNH